jgi:hypothetical protein
LPHSADNQPFTENFVGPLQIREVVVSSEDQNIASHQAGSTDPDQLDGLIGAAWSEAITNPADRARIAALLGVSDQQLERMPPPYHVEVTKAGLTGAEILIVMATAFATAYAKELGTSAGKATVRKLQELWPLIKDLILNSEPEALGSELGQNDL